MYPTAEKESFTASCSKLGWMHPSGMNACSGDLCKKIVEAKERGMPTVGVARTFGVGLSSSSATLSDPGKGRGSYEGGGALVEATGWALEAITPEDARGWFGHCGYTLRDQLLCQPL